LELHSVIAVKERRLFLCNVCLVMNIEIVVFCACCEQIVISLFYDVSVEIL